MPQPSDHRARVDAAVALKKSRQLPEAQRQLQELATERPDDTYCLGHLAHVLLLRGRVREATAHADEVLAREAGNRFALYVRGEAAMREKRYADAARDLAAAHAAGFRSSWLLRRLADAQRFSGDPDAARRSLERGLQDDPGDGQLLLALGRLEKATGQEEAATRHIEAAARQLTDDPFAYKELVATRARAHGPAAAVGQLEQLLRVPSRAANPHIHDELSRLKTELGDAEGAAAAAARAHELEPDNPRFRQRYGFALVRAQRDAEAVTEFEECLTRDPESAVLNRSYIAARRRLGQLELARRFYEEQRKRHPDARKLYGYLKRVAKEAAETE